MRRGLKMQIKKYVVYILCSLLIVSLLSSCKNTGSSTSDVDTKKGTENVIDAGETSKDKDEDSNFNETGFPIVNEKVTFRLVAIQSVVGGPYNEMTMIKKHEELTNVHIEWEEVPADNYQERKSLILNSRDLPDGFFGSTLNDDDILRYGPQGILIPLEGLIEKYGVELKRVMEEDPVIRSVITAPDGHIYSLPQVEQQAYLEAGAHFFINKTWLDMVGIDKLPETTDEFAQALLAFKEAGDLNGNGKNDEIPFSFIFNNDIDGINALFGAWGIPDNTTHISLDENKKVVCTATLDSYKEGLKYFNDLYTKGLIDPEAFTQDNSQYVSKGKVDDLVYGAFLKWADFHVVDWEKARNDYTYLLPLKGPNGEQNWLYNDQWYQRNRFSITSACENPEILYRWADAMFGEIESVEWIYGAMDECITMQDDGTIGWLPSPEGMNQQEWRAKSTPISGPAAVLLETCKKLDRSGEEGVIRRMARTEAYRPYLYMNYYPRNVWFTPEQNEALSTMRIDIINYINKASAEFITKGGIDEGWDAYINQLNKMGLQEMLKIYQEAYDIYSSNQ